MIDHHHHGAGPLVDPFRYLTQPEVSLLSFSGLFCRLMFSFFLILSWLNCYEALCLLSSVRLYFFQNVISLHKNMSLGIVK